MILGKYVKKTFAHAFLNANEAFSDKAVKIQLALMKTPLSLIEKPGTHEIDRYGNQ